MTLPSAASTSFFNLQLVGTLRQRILSKPNWLVPRLKHFEMQFTQARIFIFLVFGHARLSSLFIALRGVALKQKSSPQSATSVYMHLLALCTSVFMRGRAHNRSTELSCVTAAFMLLKPKCDLQHQINIAQNTCLVKAQDSVNSSNFLQRASDFLHHASLIKNKSFAKIHSPVLGGPAM